MTREQSIRTVLFYMSLAIFFLGLPFILAFSLGYKFDPRTLKFTRGGLIMIKTVPGGASVFLNKLLVKDKTPVMLNELIPGTYQIDLELEGHYSYFAEVRVEPGKVVRLEKVILFPLRPDIQKLNKEKISAFWIDEIKAAVYYIDKESKTIYTSDLEGDHFKEAASFPPLIPPPKRWELSPDRDKLLFFNAHEIGLVYLGAEEHPAVRERMFTVQFPYDTINEVFWYSDSYHLVMLTDKKVMITEARQDAIPVSLIPLNKKNATGSYDVRTDTLFFIDAQEAVDGKMYDNLYKIELHNRLYPFSDFIRLKPNERREKN